MIGKIIRHELKDIWKHEAHDFTKWMENNLDDLSEALGFELTLIRREQSVGSFSVDILAKDEYDNNVVIENQLEKTDHTHLGQIVTYCANLDAKICVWISKEPRQEHINAVNWLNKETNLQIYMVRVEAISIDKSKPAPLFHVICKPDEEIKRANLDILELSDRGKFNIQFWTEMNEKCFGRIPNFSKKKPQKYHFCTIAAGRGGFSYSFIVSSKFYSVELYIDSQDADENEFYLNTFEVEKNQIEKEFGGKFNFDPIPEKRACRIRHVIGEGDILDLDKNAIQEILIEKMIKLQNVLQKRISKLPEYNQAA